MWAEREFGLFFPTGWWWTLLHFDSPASMGDSSASMGNSPTQEETVFRGCPNYCVPVISSLWPLSLRDLPCFSLQNLWDLWDGGYRYRSMHMYLYIHISVFKSLFKLPCFRLQGSTKRQTFRKLLGLTAGAGIPADSWLYRFLVAGEV